MCSSRPVILEPTPPALSSAVMAKPEELLYSHSVSAMMNFRLAINCAIILEKSHRFKDDPIWGAILERLRTGSHTSEDIDTINSRLVGESTGIDPPEGNDVFRVVPTNRERVSILCLGFKKHLQATHPSIDAEDLPPDHTVIIEAAFTKNKRDLSSALTDFITTSLGDNDIKVTAPWNSKDAKIDPALRLFVGAMLMINSNEDLSDNRANGTVCKCVGIRLKPGARRQIKNWDGKIILQRSRENLLLTNSSSRV